MSGRAKARPDESGRGTHECVRHIYTRLSGPNETVKRLPWP